MIPHYLIFWASLLLICGYAFWRGRKEERVAAAACLLATIITVWIIPPVSVRYRAFDPVELCIDAAMLATFVAIALRSDRFWPLWVAGLQLTMSMSHLMKAMDEDLLPRAYAAAAVLWSYPILLIILVGTWRAHRDKGEAQGSGPLPA
jgi:hypothetical protein